MARRTQQQELVALFAADGMTLDPALIPTDTAVSTYALTRDEAAERKAAAFLLGDNLERTTQGGGIYTYTSQQGAAGGQDAALIDGKGDGGVEHRRTVPQADSRCSAAARFVQCKYRRIVRKRLAEIPTKCFRVLL